MGLKEKLYTAEEFWDFCQLPENDGRRFELVDGEIVEMAGSSLPNSSASLYIGSLLMMYGRKTGLGRAFGADGSTRLTNNLIRIPDASFISKARLATVEGKLMPPPDLAVEVVSPDEDIFKKTREYLYNGVTEVWAVYTDSQELIIFNLDEDGNLANKRYGINDIIRNRPILPNFEMAIGDIFSD
ncbi:MAG: Uma2 family endonuclease [bacterium]|nr:Uma2 family endonuclease [bacterium]